MVEFNLLPDVKLAFIRARRMKRVVITFSILIGAVSLAVFAFLISFVDIAQKVKLNSLDNSIAKVSTELKSNTNLNEILTIQNQLQTLPKIESQTPVPDRLFGYLSQLVPVNATISSLNIDLTANDITVSGSANSLATVNQLVDTLKFTNYDLGTTKNIAAFNTVVLSSFSYSSTAGITDPAQYTISFNFDPKLFNSADNVSLVIPQIVTTRSIISQPTDLFVASPSSSSGGSK